MKITSIDDAKLQLDKQIKFFSTDAPENLQGLDSFTGTVKSISSSWEYTKDGDKCTSFSCHVDVTDPVDGGLHHMNTSEIFSIDTEDIDIKNVEINDKIAKLQTEVIELEASKVSLIEKEPIVIEKEILK